MCSTYIPHWTWPEHVGEAVTVQCYTSYHHVELFVNGISQGKQERYPKDQGTSEQLPFYLA